MVKEDKGDQMTMCVEKQNTPSKLWYEIHVVQPSCESTNECPFSEATPGHYNWSFKRRCSHGSKDL